MSAQPRTSKLYIAGGILLAVTLALMVFVQAAFNLSSVISPTEPNEILLAYTLSTIIFLVLLVFGFILLRILVKVWAERRAGKPGSRFKTSLLKMLGILTLIPAISVFAYAYGLVNRSLDKWFSVPVDRVFETTRKIEGLNHAWEYENARSLVNYLAANLPADLGDARESLKMRAVVLLDSRGSVVEVASETGIDAAALARKAYESLGEEPGDIALLMDDSWVAARQVQQGNERHTLVGILPAQTEVATLNDLIAAEEADYRKLKEDKNAYRDRYAAVLGIMTVLVLFAAVWLALFLSKRITVPIEALAAATREISKGNLDHRVSGVTAPDELGMLVQHFNEMAARLQSATAELDTRRRYMEIILENIPSAVIAVDADLRVQTLNRAARTMFGVDKAEGLQEVFRVADLQNVQTLLSEAENRPVTRELSFHTPGSPTESAVTVNRLSAGGFVLVVEDLTEIVRAQKASAWREVARRLAHEIKNPLTPIQLSAERISRNIGRLPSATPRVAAVMQECVGAITDEVSSLKNLVDEFVNFARLPMVSRVPHNLRELVEKTVGFYEGRREGLRISLRIPEDLPLVLVDPVQMKRVLIIILDNALEALSQEPEPSLVITCELARDGAMARLAIEDNGCGIAPEDRERLFAPYFTTRKDGTGLGLSIASRIVSDHGGYIGVEPNSPKGTRFIIELPVCQESLLSTTNLASGSR